MEEADIIRLFTTEPVKEFRTLYSGHGDDDFREAIFVTLGNDERFVIKVAGNSLTSSESIRMWQRCAQEYIGLGYYCPRILNSLAGDFPSVEYKGNSCIAYAEEYAKYGTAEHIKNRRNIRDEVYKMTARVAAKKFDYTDIPSAYALYHPVYPWDEVDEVTENALNFREYCESLPEGFKEQTDRMFRRWEENYNKLKETYFDLPFSVFQADFNDTNVLVDEDGAFVGVLDFNCAGRDNFLNYLFREINEPTLEQTADEILRALTVASKYYIFSEEEIEAAPRIFRCVKPLWYCSVSELEDAGMDFEQVQKILDAMEYAQTCEIDFRSVMLR
ncbi:MAG: phosphotransferase [Lachnospiraceae bacterium]|nr:phosphotransferase [Lachnospiraceae bacterium]